MGWQSPGGKRPSTKSPVSSKIILENEGKAKKSQDKQNRIHEPALEEIQKGFPSGWNIKTQESSSSSHRKTECTGKGN